MVWLRLRRWVVRPIFWALAAIAVVGLLAAAVLRSEWVRERGRAIAERELSRRLGGRVSIGRLDFALLPLGVELRDVTCASPRRGAPAWLTLRRLVVEIDSDALRQDVVDLETVLVEGARLVVAVDAAGEDNLPRGTGGGKGGRFDVRVGGLYLADSVFVLAHEEVPLDLEAHDVAARLAGLGNAELEGRVSVGRVRLTLPRAQPVEAAVEAKVRLGAAGLRILDGRVVAPETRASVRGTIGWRGGLDGKLTLDVGTRGALLDRLGYFDGEVGGDLRFAGGLHFTTHDWRLSGELTAGAVSLFGFSLTDLSAEVEGGRERIAAALEEARLHGAAIDGSFVVTLQGERQAGLRLRASELPVRPLLADLQLPDFALAAVARGELAYDFPLGDARHGRGRGQFAFTPDPLADPSEIPASGEAALSLAAGRLTLDRVSVETPAESIDVRGDYDLAARHGRLVAELVSSSLAETDLLQRFLVTEPPPIWLPVAGSGRVDLALDLAPETYAAKLSLELAGVQAAGFSAARAGGSLTIDPSGARDLDLRLERPDGVLDVRGAIPLAKGREAPAFRLEVAAKEWPFDQARPWLPVALPLAGRVNGTISLEGLPESPSGRAAGRLTEAEVAGIRATALAFDLAFDPEHLEAASLALELPAGTIRGEGRLVFGPGDLEATFAGPGLDLSAPPWRELWADRIGGRLDLEGSLGGTLAAPRARLDGVASGLRLGALAVAGTAPATLHAELGGGRIEATLEVPELLRLNGGGPFVPGGETAVDLVLTSEHLDRLAALALSSDLGDLSGRLVAEIGFRQKAGEPLAATIRVPELVLERAGHRLTPIEPLVAGIDAEGLRIDSLYLGEASTGDELFLSGRVRLGEKDPGLDLRLQGSVGVGWFQPWTGLDLEGRVEALATIHGTLGAPSLNGQAELHDGRWVPAGFPHSFEGVRALLLLYPDFLVLDQGRADFAGGVLSASGRVDLPRTGLPLNYRFQANAKRVNLRYPEGWLLRGDGDLTLASTGEGRQVKGLVELDRVYYLQDVQLSPAQLVERLLARTRVQVEETDELLASTYLSVAIEAPGALRIRNNLARISGGAELTLRGTLAQPVLFGEAVTDPDATVNYGGNTYTLERGIVHFANPARIDPVLDVVAVTKVDDYSVRVNLSGSLDRLATSFSSDPPLPDLDVVALLATGSTSGSAVAASPTTSGEQGVGVVEGVLYGQAAAILGQRVGKLFGVDKLRIDPTIAGSTVSSARVTVGKRLGRRVYVTYSVDPASTAQQVLQVEWRVSDRMTLLLSQSGNDSYAVDARWETRF